ncbi:DUF3343 domain-containing protein [Clostridiaceae bacterium 35-E11]
MKDYYCAVTFHSTYHAIQFEKTFKELGYMIKLMPVPRQISSSCGTAATFPCELWDRIKSLSQKYHVEIDDVHKVYATGNSNWFKKMLGK